MLASILLAAALTPAPAATAAPAPNPAVEARAKDWFHRLQTGNIDSSQLDDEASQALNSDVALIISTDWNALGAPLSFDEIRVDEPTDTSPDWTYVYRLTFRNDIALDFFFDLDSRGLIGGMRLGPEEQ